MSEMQRGRRAVNCANRYCFHLSISASISALEDELISSAVGLRFKHLSGLFPSSSSSSSSPSVSQPVAPRVSPLLHASITENDYRSCTHWGGALKVLLDGQTMCSQCPWNLQSLTSQLRITSNSTTIVFMLCVQMSKCCLRTCLKKWDNVCSLSSL